MKRMTRIVSEMILASALGCVSIDSHAVTGEPEGFVSYSLPSTTISLTVDAVRESFHAGPYARFAGKYLGIEAQVSDAVRYHIEKISMTPLVEADHASRFMVPGFADVVEHPLMRLSSSGLVTVRDGNFGNELIWRFPAKNQGDFSGKGLNSNLKSESTTLFSVSKKQQQSSFQQKMTVEKSLDQKAKEAADMILGLREKRLQIVTGDTDATYSGEALGAAVDELDELEKEYLSLFVGYTEYSGQRVNFDVIPQKDRENQMYIAFRLSDADGLMPADYASGRPVVMKIIPDALNEQSLPEKSKVRTPKNAVSLHYRIPATCTVNLMEGTKLLLQARVPVYQLGIESVLPVQIVTK